MVAVRVTLPDPSDPGLQLPLAVSIALFAVGVLAGSVVSHPPISPDVTIESRSAWFFLSRNVTVAGILVAGGFTFGAATLATLCFNGFVVGYALTHSSMGVVRSFVLLAPHSVLELPALWLAGAAGLQLPYALLGYFAGFRDSLVDRTVLERALHLTGLSLLLLIAAALVESAVTPAVAEWIFAN